jgi:hypothetical protein
VKTSPKRSNSVIENERFGLVFAKTVSIISGTVKTTLRDWCLWSSFVPCSYPTASPLCCQKARRRHRGRLRKRDSRDVKGGWDRSQIIRRRESLIFSKSFNTLCSNPSTGEIQNGYYRQQFNPTYKHDSGATQSYCRQTRTVAAQALVDRHGQVQHKALVDRHAQVQHRIIKTDTFRCSTKALIDTDTLL